MTIKDPDDLTDVNSRVLCETLGLTHPTIGELKKKGILHQLAGPRGHWNLLDAVQAYIAYTVENRPGRGSRETKTIQETRKLTLLNDEREGKLINTGDASAVFAEYSQAIRAGVTSLPGRLAATISGMSNAAEIRALIHAEVTELLGAAEEIFGQIHADAAANASDQAGVDDATPPAGQDDSTVGGRKQSATKGKRGTRKVA